MKILIIADSKCYTQEQLNEFAAQDIAVNYTLIDPTLGQDFSYLHSINKDLIKQCPNIIFKVKNFYQTTRKEIEYALVLRKYKPGYNSNIRIDVDDKQFRIKHIEEWRNLYETTFSRQTMKHPVLIMFENSLAMYKQKLAVQQQATKDEHVYKKYTNLEEITSWCRAFAPQWKVDIDYNDVDSIARGYEQMQFYFENNIPYDLDFTEIYKGAIHPMDDGLFNEEMFVLPPYSIDDEELIETFGNSDYMDDEVQKCMKLR